MNKLKFAVLVLVAASFLAVRAAENESAGFSPEEALSRLKNGNDRFVEGTAKHPRTDAARRAETVKDGQHPIATVIACSDSREPVEIVCDQGVGDVFIIRVAGNVCNTDEIASVEYGVGHLGTPVCVVMGHTNCGAVTAAATDAELHGNLPALIGFIYPAVQRAKKSHPELSGKALVPAAIEANVWLSIENLFHRSAEVRKHAAEGKVLVVGAIYDLASGKITWLGPHPEQKQLLGEK